jgi:energy-coupling factor transport system ATP-binding protein
MAASIDIRDLTFRYVAGSPAAISGLSLTVEEGNCLAVLGPTGAGKSTLLHLLAGSAAAHLHGGSAAGTIRIGTELFDPFPRRVLFPRTALALQDARLQLSGVCTTVREELAFSLNNLGIDPVIVAERTERALRFFGLEQLVDRDPLSLSGGELQRVVLASLLAVDPPVVLLDEPANALDAMMSHRVARLLQSLKGEHTVIFTDYKIDLALAAADDVVVLDQGTIRFHGSRTEFAALLATMQPILPVRAWTDLASTVQRVDPTTLRPSIRRLVMPS